jgi:hypothetical protein
MELNVLKVSDYEKRGEIVLRNAEKIDCNKFLTAADIANVSLFITFFSHSFID